MARANEPSSRTRTTTPTPPGPRTGASRSRRNGATGSMTSGRSPIAVAASTSATPARSRTDSQRSRSSPTGHRSIGDSSSRPTSVDGTGIRSSSTPTTARSIDRLTTTWDYDLNPSWAPTGDLIAFDRRPFCSTCLDRRGRGDLFIDPGEGGRERRLTDHPDARRGTSPTGPPTAAPSSTSAGQPG